MSIEKINQGDQLTHSMDLVQENIQRLKELFPEIVTEGKIDFKVLQEVLGNELEEGEEYYRFTWAGKAQARREAHKPSTGTLRPCKDESVDWDSTENLYIEGDNLEVLKLLQKSYAGKVKVICIDPPYNTGNDFVYKDNYKDNLKNYQAVTGQVDEESNKLTTNSESDGRFHSNWLNMMYPRLNLARNLLKDDGVAFINIDDNEVENLRRICNEVFGEENFSAQIPWRKRTTKTDVPFGISQDYEWVLVYIKKSFYAGLEFERKYYSSDDYPNDRWRLSDLTTQKTEDQRPNSAFDLVDPKTGKVYKYNPRRLWGITKDTFDDYYQRGKIVFPDDYNFLNISIPSYRVFESEDKLKAIEKYGFDTPVKAVSTHLEKIEVGMSENGNKEITDLFSNKIFSFPKPIGLIKFFLKTTLDKNALVLDFFAGSSTSAHAVMQINSEDNGNRKFIQIQLPEKIDEKNEAYKSGYKTITEIGKERIRRAGKKIIQTKKEELIKLKETNSILQEDHNEIIKIQKEIDNLDIGFKVFKLDSSNIKGWDGNPEELENSLFDSQDNIKEDRTEEDVLFEILLKYGLDLTLPIEEKLIEGKKVFNVGVGALFICLADGITSKVAEGVGAWKQELQPETCRVIFKDSGFTDVEKTNSVQILKRFGITEVKSI